MYNHCCQLMPVRGDGSCSLNAIDWALYCDHNEVVTLNNLASNILDHLWPISITMSGSLQGMS